MDDPEFELRLSRWLSEAPEASDADQFARRVQRRLERSWTLRRVFIAVAGLVGGLFAAGQMLGGYLFHNIGKASGDAVAAAMATGKTLGELRLLTLLPVGAEVLWVGVGLGVLAIVLLATRALENM